MFLLCLIILYLQRVLALFPCPYPDRFLDPHDKDLAVAYLAGPRGIHYGIHRLYRGFFGRYNLNLYLRQEIHLIFGAPVKFRMAFLTAKAAHLGNRHALDIQFVKGLFHVFEFERFYYRLYLFHAPSPLCQSSSKKARVPFFNEKRRLCRRAPRGAVYLRHPHRKDGSGVVFFLLKDVEVYVHLHCERILERRDIIVILVNVPEYDARIRRELPRKTVSQSAETAVASHVIPAKPEIVGYLAHGSFPREKHSFFVRFSVLVNKETLVARVVTDRKPSEISDCLRGLGVINAQVCA